MRLGLFWAIIVLGVITAFLHFFLTKAARES